MKNTDQKHLCGRNQPSWCSIRAIAKLQAACVLISLVASGCALNLGLVKPTAKLQGVGSYQEPVYVFIDDSIQNDFDVKTAALKTAHVKDYRKSLEEGFKNSFAGVFQEVLFTNSIPKSGYAVHLQKASPKHVIINMTQQVENNSSPGYVVRGYYVPGYSYDTVRTTCDVAIAVTWYACLYHDGRQVRASDGNLVSQDRAQNIAQAPLVMKNALEMMLDKLGTDLFRTPALTSSGVGRKE